MPRNMRRVCVTTPRTGPRSVITIGWSMANAGSANTADVKTSAKSRLRTSFCVFTTVLLLDLQGRDRNISPLVLQILETVNPARVKREYRVGIRSPAQH